MTTTLASLILLAALGAIGESALAATNAHVTSTAAAVGPRPTLTLSLDGASWLLDTDHKNLGRTAQCFNTPTKEAKPTRVPWIIQEAFPAYHGVVWYWHDSDRAVE